MNSKLASWVVGLALGIAPIAAHAQMAPMAKPAAPPQGNPGELTETQWLRQRVEQLQAALARGDNCAVKPRSNAAAPMPKPSEPPAPMPMEKEGDM